MATFKAYPNGSTMGVGNAQPVGGARGTVTGWSKSSVRRHKRWLYSVESDGLTGSGCGVTLTLRDTPPGHEDWARVCALLFQRLRDAGMIRWHWVVEWQRRGTPHLHMAVYGPAEMDAHAVGVLVMRHWLALTEVYGAAPQAQDITPITGAVGWLKYLSKHASRGVAHYQRQGMPSGWKKSGRLWGYGGSWPCAEAVEGWVSTEQFWRIRRQIRRYAIAQARSAALSYERGGLPVKAAAAWDSVGYLRSMLRCSDESLSRVRGVSDWVPAPVLLDLAVWSGWSGEIAEPSEGAA